MYLLKKNIKYQVNLDFVRMTNNSKWKLYLNYLPTLKLKVQTEIMKSWPSRDNKLWNFKNLVSFLIQDQMSTIEKKLNDFQFNSCFCLTLNKKKNLTFFFFLISSRKQIMYENKNHRPLLKIR